MEKAPGDASSYESRQQQTLEDLRALAEIFGLEIIREERYGGTMSIVVDNGKGEEVHIGYPDGRNVGKRQGGQYPAAATDTIWTIPRENQGAYGHGAWRISIKI